MVIIVRNAQIEDATYLSANNVLMARETEDRHLDSDTVLQGVTMILENPQRGRYLIAESEGRRVGQCLVTYEWSDWRCGDFWWIQSVYVEPGFRRRGVFTSMYRFIMDLANESELVAGVRLYVEKDNISAKQTYRNLGMIPAQYTMFEIDFTR